MTDHTHSRNYHESLRRLGVENPGEVPIRTPVQAVAVMEDVRRLNRELEVPRFAGGVDVTPGAGLFGVLRLTAGIHGARILYFGESTYAKTIVVTPPPAGYTQVAVITPDFQTGDPTTAQTSILEHGTRLAVVGTVKLVTQFQHYDWAGWLPPGQAFEMMNDTANDVWQPWIVWEEVPMRSALNPPE